MSKFTYSALFAALLSVNAYAVTAVGDEVTVDADFTVGTPPSQLAASWQARTGIEPGTYPDGTEVGQVNVSGVTGPGWVLYGTTSNANFNSSLKLTEFTFTHNDQSTIKTKVAHNNSGGVSITHGTGVGAGLSSAATFIRGVDEAVLVLSGQQALKSGVYSTQFAVKAFTD
ncbi:TPA: hypothetical protein ACF24J_003406 [Escherichia coli]